MSQDTTAGLPTVTTPTTLVIFGATGALAKRYLFATLLKLQRQGLLPKQFRVIGVARQALSDQVFRGQITDALAGAVSEDDRRHLAGLLRSARYLSGDLREPGWTEPLTELLTTDEPAGDHQLIFYLATAPSLFASTITALGKAKLAGGAGRKHRAQIVIEKPFGHDAGSAAELNGLLAKYFREEQIYRMDHYLGKDTVQNILALRFENGLFEPIWNRHNIDHVQITFAEDFGLGSRGRYYEESGALRDIIQNHLLQLMAHIAMEPPADLSAEALRNRRAAVLQHLRPLQRSELKDRVVRGQYGAGETMYGEVAKAYKDEEFVADDSTTETFVAMPVELMTDRWIGVPFYLRTGKRLPKPVVEINIQFKPSAHDLYRKSKATTANLLTLRIQPNEGIALRLVVKKPGYAAQLEDVDMSFCYRDVFIDKLPEAYDRLLLDCLLGDQTLFTRADEVAASWEFVTPILEFWKKSRPPEFPNYQAGTWGPKAAADLIGSDGRRWWSDRLDVCPIPGAGQAVVQEVAATEEG